MSELLPPTEPKHPYRERAALASYWVLFILSPLAAVTIQYGISTASIVVFVGLVMIGEHALRPWRRLWRLP